MDVKFDEMETAMAVVNGLAPRFENLIVAFDALEI